MRPEPIASPADTADHHGSSQGYGDAPAARHCVAPPPDDRLDHLRRWLAARAHRLSRCARHLIDHAALGDAAAWKALEADLDAARAAGPVVRVAAALKRGELDAAVLLAAAVSGERDPDAWLRGMRALAPQNGGAR